MPLPMLYESYPFIAPEKYKGKLDGKVVVVTGASSGIGVGLAKALAAAGGRVACVARREEGLKKTVDAIKAAGNEAIAVPADLTKKGGAVELVSKVESQLGPIDVLVNNAGIARITAMECEDEDLEYWWRVYEVNVRAPVALIRAVLPSMLKRQSGILITVSSAVATMNLPAMTSYASSKAAITKFHELLEHEIKGTGIVSYNLNPGMVESELGQNDGGINHAAMEHPVVKGFIAMVTQGEQKRQHIDLPSNTVVALAADEQYRKLSGKYIDVCIDQEAVLKEAEKENLGKIESEKLYVVNIASL